MADTFTHFSCLFDVGTPENAAQALVLAATSVDDEDDARGDGFVVSIDEPGSSRLWIRDDGSGDPERVIGFARRCAAAFGLTGRWGFQYANSCSRPRLRTDDGERIVGRRVSPAWVASILASDGAAPALGTEDAFAALRDGRIVVDLADGLQLRRARVMHADRIELLGFTEAMRERLKADGLFGEIISWKLRLFVPTGADGPAVLGRLFVRWPVARVSERTV